MNYFRNERDKIDRMVTESPAHRRGTLLENIADVYLDALQSEPKKRLAYLCRDLYEQALSYVQDTPTQRVRVLIKLQQAYLILGLLDKPEEHWLLGLDAARMATQVIAAQEDDLQEQYILMRLFQAETFYNLSLHQQRPDRAEQAIAAAKIVYGLTRHTDNPQWREQSFAALLLIGRSYLAIADHARTIEQVAHALDEGIQQLAPVRYIAPDGMEGKIVLVLLLLAELYRAQARVSGRDHHLQAARRTLDVLDTMVPPHMHAVQGYAYYTRSLIAERLDNPEDTVHTARTAADFFQQANMTIMALIARFRAFYLGLPTIFQITLFPAWLLVHLVTNRVGDIL